MRWASRKWRLSTTTALNTAIGYEALYALQLAAVNNTAVGANAGQSVTTGGSNTILGRAVASTTLTTGSNNIPIGVSSTVDTPAATTSNYIDIMPAAPNGWICVAQDQTTNITGRQSANTTTSITTTWSAAPANGDHIEYMCAAR